MASPVQGIAISDTQATVSYKAHGRDPGVDIFAKAGTPVLAVGDATVVKVGQSPLGGNRVWIKTNQGKYLYYAHLSGIAVYQGQQVKNGQLLGWVGNTGNAKSTASHLHIGATDTGPGGAWVDPSKLISQDTGTTAEPYNPRKMIKGGEGGGLADSPASGNPIIDWLETRILGPLKLQAEFTIIMFVGVTLFILALSRTAGGKTAINAGKLAATKGLVK